ncbi:serine/threonine-protein kinase MARK1 [Tupaia chinensis]|nr:serine/threonine-protein kinase MARK1 [Tupaia chinensis]
MSTEETTFTTNYELLETISQGRFGKVNLAWYLPTGTQVAIKVVSKESFHYSSCLSKVYQEINILMSLNHKNIIRALESFDTKDTLYLVMEYAPGGSLEDNLSIHGPMMEEEAQMVFLQLASALEYCHNQCVVHRDLKPANILLDGIGAVKLADFGVSTRFTAGQKLDEFCGTIFFMAPEVLSWQGYDGPAVDIWSFGVTLYMMVTGAIPFWGTTLEKLRNCVLRGEFTLPPSLSHQIEDLLKNILAPDPTERLTLEQIQHHPWFHTIQENAESPPEYVGKTIKVKPLHHTLSNEMKGSWPPVIPSSFSSTESEGQEAYRVSSLCPATVPSLNIKSTRPLSVSPQAGPSRHSEAKFIRRHPAWKSGEFPFTLEVKSTPRRQASLPSASPRNLEAQPITNPPASLGTELAGTLEATSTSPCLTSVPAECAGTLEITSTLPCSASAPTESASTLEAMSTPPQPVSLPAESASTMEEQSTTPCQASQPAGSPGTLEATSTLPHLPSLPAGMPGTLEAEPTLPCLSSPPAGSADILETTSIEPSLASLPRELPDNLEQQPTLPCPALLPSSGKARTSTLSPAPAVDSGASLCCTDSTDSHNDPEGDKHHQGTASASQESQGRQGITRRIITCLRRLCCLPAPKIRKNQVAPTLAEAQT